MVLQRDSALSSEKKAAKKRPAMFVGCTIIGVSAWNAWAWLKEPLLKTRRAKKASAPSKLGSAPFPARLGRCATLVGKADHFRSSVRDRAPLRRPAVRNEVGAPRRPDKETGRRMELAPIRRRGALSLARGRHMAASAPRGN